MRREAPSGRDHAIGMDAPVAVAHGIMAARASSPASSPVKLVISCQLDTAAAEAFRIALEVE
jgi:hypothetical protein